MNRLVGVFLFSLISSLCAGQSRWLGGYVRDQSSGEPLINATIQTNQAGTAVLTNQAGYFRIQVRAQALLTVSYVGYQSYQLLADTVQNAYLTISLRPQEHTLTEVAVVASPDPVLASPSVLTLPVAQLKRVPMALGETDIVKALALTPGVTVGNEATAGLLVRGGSPDQNLIRLDEATLYNQTHLFGFASSFNADAVKNVTLYKGAFPARFGGRLSSVLDVTSRDGNQYKTQRELNVGLLSSRFLIEGPLGRSRRKPTTYMLSARSSYITLFLLPQLIRYNQGKANSYLNYWLYDINGKVTVHLDSTRKVSFSLFKGQDTYYGWEASALVRAKFGLDWGNTTATARYEQPLGPNVFWTNTLAYSLYGYQTGYRNYSAESASQLVTQTELRSSVRDWTLRSNLEWFATPRYLLRTGLETITHRYQPSAVRTQQSDNQSPITNQPIRALEQALYLENEWQPYSPLKINGGLRTVAFAVEQKTYMSIEPRLSAAWQLPRRVQLTFAYSQMRQFVHQISSNVIGIPNDVWVPATAQVPPQQARQISIGLSRSINRGQWRVSLEAYQKLFDQLIDVPTGTDLLAEFNQGWQQRIERNGTGRAQGLEFFLHKPAGRLNGWLSYTLSSNKRRFTNLNQGEWFRANFDRRHVGAAALSYVVRPRLTLSAVWQYQSGQPVTVPSAFFYDPQSSFYPNYIYTRRNTFEAPAFHRLDVSAVFTKVNASGFQRSWTLGVMNLYNRANPLFMTLTHQGIYAPGNRLALAPTGYQTQLTYQSFLPVLPYVSYAKTF